ncbi:molybdopterin molybdotransferase MoeA [Leptospira sp. 96542]|nr:molybdopterin molybdotransferase MoeA [Leptospira sp. 96542]
MISYEEALVIVSSTLVSPNIESIDLMDSLGRITAEVTRADRDYPPFNRSAMDGFAILTKEYRNEIPLRYDRELHAGEEITLTEDETIIKIMTGAPVPIGLDSVIKIEDTELTELDGKKYVTFRNPKTKLWDNIAKRGEDVRFDEIVLDKGVSIGVSELALLASLGKHRINVSRLPKVTILSTGNEIIPINQTPLNFQIRDSNSYTISAILKKYGIKSTNTRNIGDNKKELTDYIDKSKSSDILIISGGVSMGDMDLIPDILHSLGGKQIFHKVAIKPGKPIWFGSLGTTIVFALPGNPFSVQTCARIFLEPFLQKFLGQNPKKPLKLPIAFQRSKKTKLAEFVPVRLETKDKTHLIQVPYNGSGDIRCGLSSAGLAFFPETISQFEEGTIVDFYPW